jgi:hypothetical protein
MCDRWRPVRGTDIIGKAHQRNSTFSGRASKESIPSDGPLTFADIGIMIFDLLPTSDLAKWQEDWDNGPGKSIASIDPGSRTFQTIFDARNCRVIKFGDGLALYVKQKFQKKRRKLQGEADLIKNLAANDWKTSYDAKHHEMVVLQGRHDAYMERVHITLTRLLTAFDVLIDPYFATGEMGRKSNRISAAVTSQLAGLQFAEFKKRLAYVCKKRGVVRHQCNEAWTTQWCRHCNAFTPQGPSKVFRCTTCKHGRTARDPTSAMAIFVKTLVRNLPPPADCSGIPATEVQKTHLPTEGASREREARLAK